VSVRVRRLRVLFLVPRRSATKAARSRSTEMRVRTQRLRGPATDHDPPGVPCQRRRPQR